MPRQPLAICCLTFALVACSNDPEVARNNPSDASPQLDASAEAPDNSSEGGVDAPAETAKDGCVATCFGRHCGSDGCGGICGPGCAQGAACLDDGTCDRGCIAAFAASIEDVSLQAMTLDEDGKLYASGYDANGGVVRALTSCSGATLGSAPVALEGALSTTLSSVASAGDFLYVGGTARGLQDGDPGAGLVARVNKTLLTTSWVVPLAGSDELDELHFVSVDDTGGLWAGGALNATAPAAWLLRVAGDGSYCAFDGPGSSGSIRSAWSAPGSGALYLTGEADGVAFVSRHASASCWQSGSCAAASSCQPDWSASFAIDSRPATPRDLVVAGAYAYVAGELGAPDSDTAAFVAAVSLSTGNVAAVYELNPSPLRDGFLAITFDDASGLYVTGAIGWTGDATYSGARRIAAKLLAPTLELVWKHEAASESVGRDIVADAIDGVYLLSSTATDSKLVRCTKAGLCP